MTKTLNLWSGFIVVIIFISSLAWSQSHAAASTVTVMFYLDRQNQDHVDPYVFMQYRDVIRLSEDFPDIRWITLSDEIMEEKKSSYRIEDQKVVVREWHKGNAVELARYKGKEPAFSNPQVLSFLLETALFPRSTNNILVMADHGVGAFGLMTTSLVYNGKKIDAAMSNKDAANTIKSVMDKKQASIDLIVMDACNMSSIEALTDYRIAGLSMPMVVSENTTTPTSGGVSYNAIFRAKEVKAQMQSESPDMIEIGIAMVKASKGNPAANMTLVDLLHFTPEIQNTMKQLFAQVSVDLKDLKTQKKYMNDIVEELNKERSRSIGVFEIDFRGWLQMVQQNEAGLSMDARRLAAQVEMMIFPEQAAEGAKPDRAKLVVITENDFAADVQQRGLSICHPMSTDDEDAQTKELYLKALESLRGLAFWQSNETGMGWINVVEKCQPLSSQNKKNRL